MCVFPCIVVVSLLTVSDYFLSSHTYTCPWYSGKVKETAISG